METKILPKELTSARQRGATAYHAGLAAESIAQRHYEQAGYTLLVQRWRGKAGEIDLIFSKNDETVFVEVKRARDFSQAVERIGPAQMVRIATGRRGVCGQITKRSS